MDPFQEVASQRLSLGLRVPQGRSAHSHTRPGRGWGMTWVTVRVVGCGLGAASGAPGREGTSTWQSAGNQSDPKD